jgi:uncharacterized protein YjbI with pentapeptide repeats
MNGILEKLAHPLRKGEVEDLRGAVIEAPLELENAALPHVDFSGATFNAPVALRGAIFQGLAWFTDCTFNAPADFSGTQFLSDARFDKVRFQRGGSFSGAEFHGVACFDQA